MRKSRRDTRTFLLDTNVFISAIKEPKKQTAALKLILKIAEDPRIKLVGNDLLAEEMLRYTELLKSETAVMILSTLLAKMEIVKVSGNYRKICKMYIETPDKADILHAATCLQTGSILITNDRHFDKIADERIIEVWNIGEALKRLL